MDERILKRLAERFDNVLEKPGGKGFKYVPSDDVFDRMNKTFRGNWSTEVLYQDIVDDQALVRVRVIAQDPTSPDSAMYYHEGFASQPVARYNFGDNKGKVIDLGNTYMAAMSKAVKQACKKWGVALGLDELDEETAPVLAPPPPIQMPSRTLTPPPASLAPSTPAPAVKEVSAPVLTQPNLVTPTVNKTTVMSNIPINTPAMPPLPPAPEKKAMLPSIPGPVADPAKKTNGDSMNGSSGGGKITDVQKIALQGLLTLRGLDYDKLVADAFAAEGVTRDPIPSQEDLDYEDAVVIIKYGNELFRKNK